MRAKTKTAPTAPQEEIVARAERIVFYNQNNGYIVLSATPVKHTANADDSGAPADTPESASASPLSFVGYVASPVRTGEKYAFTGAWQNHSRWGRQFHFSSASLILPTGREGVAAYIASVCYGVGPAKAARIVEALGPTCLDIIRERGAEALAGIPGVRNEQAAEIARAVAENAALAELSALVCGEQVSPRLAAKIFAMYGNDSVERVRENPYLLADDVWGIGFATADRVARRVGIAEDSPFRIEAAVRHIIREARNDGHCYLDPRSINAAADTLLGKGTIPSEAIGEAAGRLLASQRLIREGDCVYLPEMYRAEQGLAARVRRMLGGEGQPNEAQQEDRTEDILSQVHKLEDLWGITYAPKQVEAVITALTSNLSIITGGAGVGKTTIVRTIVDIYRRLHPENHVYLCSPTGRAAKRLSEATGQEAGTIHRLLGYNPGYGGFGINEHNPLPGPGLLICDEASMLSLSLAYSLFQAIPFNDNQSFQVVLVGDPFQLPSVEAGNVLNDLINSGAVLTVRLDYIFRQAEGSQISELADCIKRGQVPDLSGFIGAENGEIRVFMVSDQSEVPGIVVREAGQMINRYGLTGFLALSPMYKGPAGVNNLNAEIRAAVQPEEAEPGLRIGAVEYRYGDKVLVLKNCYNRSVYNGDTGLVVKVTPGMEMLVDFGSGELVTFTPEDADIITLAYAMSVHKAQGGEHPGVIMALARSHYMLLQRNLIYTAVTRARKELVLVLQGGEGRKQGALSVAVKNDKVAKRFTRLAELVRED